MAGPNLLRPGLLSGLRVIVASGRLDAPGSSRAAGHQDEWVDAARFGLATQAVCTRLGARVDALAGEGEGEGGGEGVVADDAASRRQAQRLLDAGAVDMLVCDGQALYAASPEPGVHAVRGCADACWTALRAVATLAWIEPGRGGRVVLIAPTPDGTPWAEATRAALENAARTLSIEWARHSITLMSLAPGEDTDAHEVGELVAMLGSPAGDYFSGGQLDLRGLRA